MCVAGPLLQDGALVAVGALAHQAVDHHVLVHDVLAAPALVQGAVQQGVLAAAAVEGRTLLDDGDLGALLGGSAGSADAGQAGTDDDHVEVLGLTGLHVRLLAQPVVAGVGGGVIGSGGVGLDAHGLLDAAGGSFLDGIGGDGGTGNVVHLGALGSHQGLLQGGSGHAADVLGLVGGIHHHFGDGSLAEGHGDLHLTDAGGGAGVGAGGVNGIAGCGGSGAGGACRIAGSQSAGGDTAHGSGGSDLEEALARDLFHHDSPFSFFSSFRVCGTFSASVLSIKYNEVKGN